MKIYLARHGIREDHIDEEWEKHAENPNDPGLHELGHQQAKELADYLLDRDIEIIYTSPFLRAVQTALPFALAKDLEVRIEHGLCEALRPEWFDEMPSFHQGESLLKDYPKCDETYESLHYPEYPEPEEQLASNKRLGAFMEKFLKNETRNCLFVGHGAVVTGVSKALVGTTSNSCFKTCALNVFEKLGQSWEVVYADNAHLKVEEKNLRFD